MRSLNLDQLRTLSEVLALGSFTAAARRLNLTQPAISLQVRELEQRLGVKLVERIGNSIRATASGLRFVEQGRRILRDCEAAVAAVREMRRGSVDRVRLSATSTALTYLLPPVIRGLRERHPGVELLLTNQPTSDTLEQIACNAVDLGLVMLPVADSRLAVTPLRSARLVALLPAATADIPDAVTPDYAARQTLVLGPSRGAVSGHITRWLGRRPASLCTTMRVDTVEAMKQVAALGLGLSIVPDIAAVDLTRDVVVRPLDPPVPCTLALVERRNRPDSPALAAVRDALLALRPAMPGEPGNGYGHRAASRRTATPASKLPRRSVRLISAGSAAQPAL
jgi:DNA-binding transcriptional LysR family regulator